MLLRCSAELASKSAAHAAAGQPDIAAATALAAWPVARRAGSRRIVGQLADVAATLHPHNRIEPVARLIDELGQAA